MPRKKLPDRPPAPKDPVLELGDEQRRVFDEIETTSEHYFVTGKAGTGKSVLLTYFREKTQKQAIVVAPTGIAALNVGAQTIHSVFQLPPKTMTAELIDDHWIGKKKKDLLRTMQTLVIDEISMVRVDVMDAMDKILRDVRRKKKLPFGGVQVVAFGDLYQLPPIIADSEAAQYLYANYGGQYFFHAPVWKEAIIHVRELGHIYRQTDDAFVRLLNDVRTGNVSEETLAALNARVGEPPASVEHVVTLCTTNAGVDAINTARLRELPGQERVFRAAIEGSMEKQKNLPAEAELHLKAGAQVMFTQNDRDKRWVNGTIGTVASFEKGAVTVLIGNTSVTVEPQVWQMIEYDYKEADNAIQEKVVGRMKQYPLKLAWATTIHKAQGRTLDAARIDLGRGSFAPGQTYVALSRCRSLEGVYLTRPLRPQDVMMDPAVTEFLRGPMTGE